MLPAFAITVDEKKRTQATRVQAPAERRTRTVLTPKRMLGVKPIGRDRAEPRNDAVNANKIPSSVTMMFAF